MITKDWEALAEDMKPYSWDWLGFDPESLVQGGNILLTDGNNNYGLFQSTDTEGEYFGHYLFGKARGKAAYNTAHRLLAELFEDTDAVTVYGQTPVEYRGALWLNDKLGFTVLFKEDTDKGPCYRVALTKEGFQKNV